MGLEELLLLTAEHLDLVGAVNPPATQGLTCSLVPPDQLTRDVETDPVTIKERIRSGVGHRVAGLHADRSFIAERSTRCAFCSRIQDAGSSDGINPPP
jgi:hypothetical protein